MVAGLIRLFQLLQVVHYLHLARFVHLVRYLRAQVAPPVGFGQEVWPPAAGISVCFSEGEGKWCYTKTTVFYFGLPMSP